MADHNLLGSRGEKLAAEFLTASGYKILETNWRCGKKEVDIVAQKETIVAFVEVKTRSTTYFGLPEEAVATAKQKLLVEAADEYMQLLGFDAEVRFDIISIILSGNNYTIRHIEEAFIPLAE
ncbi:MAG: YraN family protein [Bacteroidales bacterium]|nr:YraN family protein [Bacteroidales bacterium]